MHKCKTEKSNTNDTKTIYSRETNHIQIAKQVDIVKKQTIYILQKQPLQQESIGINHSKREKIKQKLRKK